MFDKTQELVSKIGEGVEIKGPMGERGPPVSYVWLNSRIWNMLGQERENKRNK